MATLLDNPTFPVDPAVQDFVRERKQLLIGGKWVDAADGSTFPTIDPSTRGEITRVARGSAVDVDRAVQAAKKAFPAWSRTAPAQRARLLIRLADLIEEHVEELAQLDSLDLGKPVDAARSFDLPFVSEVLRYYAGWATKITGDTITTGIPDLHVYTRREPVGVVGAIIAWNFPVSLFSWKVGPALAAGCTIVVKPAEQTPLSALRLGQLCQEAGFPDGVMNIVTGYGEDAGQALVEHPDVRKIAFTGSLDVGRHIARTAADRLKHVSLELGGKSPNVIFSDADVQPAAVAAAGAIFLNSGQVCCAGSRLMVEKPIFDDVLELVCNEAKGQKLGPGLDPQTTLGPLVSEEQFERVSKYIRIGEEEGARVAHGGGSGPEATGLPGYFVEPTVLADVDDTLRVAREEIFGPVVVVQPFESVEELAQRANATEFGLAAGVWTTDVRKAHKAAEYLQAGTVWINCYNYFDTAVPWGGWKLSGYGKDLGREGLDKFLETKSVWTNLG